MSKRKGQVVKRSGSATERQKQGRGSIKGSGLHGDGLVFLHAHVPLAAGFGHDDFLLDYT